MGPTYLPWPFRRGRPPYEGPEINAETGEYAPAYDSTQDAADEIMHGLLPTVGYAAAGAADYFNIPRRSDYQAQPGYGTRGLPPYLMRGSTAAPPRPLTWPQSPAGPPPPHMVAVSQPDAPPPVTGPEPPSSYRQIIEDYLRGLQGPVELPQQQPYRRGEILAMLYGRPHMQQRVEEMHEEPYRRKLAMMQLREQRAGRAAQLAAHLEEVEATERLRRAQVGATAAYRGAQQARLAERDTALDRYRQSQLGYKATAERQKLPEAKNDALRHMDAEVNTLDDNIRSLQTTPLGEFMGETEMRNNHPERYRLLQQTRTHRERVLARRAFIANLSPEEYHDFIWLSEDQQKEIMKDALNYPPRGPLPGPNP